GASGASAFLTGTGFGSDTLAAGTGNDNHQVGDVYGNAFANGGASGATANAFGTGTGNDLITTNGHDENQIL
ncbi:MAG: hypothetical protein O8C56_01370, partial [Candidatus Methanoperedens sp.]|nr:hypothetical protein [Candidatus Methanoperedens sp.]